MTEILEEIESIIKEKELCGKVFEYSEDYVADVAANLTLLDEMIEVIKKCKSSKVYSRGVVPGDFPTYDIIIGSHNFEEAVDILLKEYLTSTALEELIEKYNCNSYDDIKEKLMEQLDSDVEIYHPLAGLDQYLEDREQFSPHESFEEKTKEKIEVIKSIYSKMEDFVSLEKILKALVEPNT